MGDNLSFARISAIFTGNYAELGSYLGMPLIAIVILFAASRRRTPTYALLVLLVIVVSLASMGPKLHVAGVPTATLPWTLCRYVPLLDKALPVRFMMMHFWF